MDLFYIIINYLFYYKQKLQGNRLLLYELRSLIKLPPLFVSSPILSFFPKNILFPYHCLKLYKLTGFPLNHVVVLCKTCMKCWMKYLISAS